MSVLVNQSTRVIGQGMTGQAGGFHADQCLAYGGTFVGGVTPNKGGTTWTGKESGKSLPVRAAGRAVELPNLCYAWLGREQIHSTAYAQAVFHRLSVAETLAGARAVEINASAQVRHEMQVHAVRSALANMAAVLENGNVFWKLTPYQRSDLHAR